MRIGTDIVKISRMERLIKNGIPSKIFTAYEARYISTKANPAQTAAGIFAAKEAVLKALGTGITLPLKDVEIFHISGGMPKVCLHGRAEEYVGGIGDAQVSISHDGEYATACVVISTDKQFEYYLNAVSKLSNASKNVITPDDVRALLPKRQSATHKGSYGRLYVLAGSVGLTGAAIMACTAALKCGAGLITLGCAKELNTIFETALTEVMTKPLASNNGLLLSCDTNLIVKAIRDSDACLIGPGLGRSEDIASIVRVCLTDTDTPCILDADALYAISNDISVLNDRQCDLMLTPHIGEFSRLTGIDSAKLLSEPDKYASEFAHRYSLTLVLKSHRTLVCTPDGNTYTNLLGNPGMATGGTGDVLAGAAASFAAQGMNHENAAKAGVYIHSLAADMAAMETGEYSLTPSDILRYLSHAIKYSAAKEM